MTLQLRIQPGVPAGGQFASRTRDADTINLVDQLGQQDWFGADPPYADPTAEAVVNSEMKLDLTGLLHRVEAGELTMTRAAVRFWEHVGKSCGAPTSASRTIDWGVARKASLLVNSSECGGAGAVATEYLRTGDRTAAVEALTLPFSFRRARVEDGDLVRIAKVLADRPAVAAQMWNALMEYATIDW